MQNSRTVTVIIVIALFCVAIGLPEVWAQSPPDGGDELKGTPTVTSTNATSTDPILPGAGDAISSGEAAQSQPPDPPRNLTATVLGQTSIRADWDAPANDGGSAITKYDLSYGPVGAIPTIIAVSGLSKTVSGLRSGTRYGFRVRAYNSAGKSSWLGGVFATTQGTPPYVPTPVPAKAPAPTGLTATASTASTVSLSWNSVKDAAGYKVERSTSSSGPWSTAFYDFSGTSHYDSGLQCNTNYYFRISARGNGSPYSTDYGSPSSSLSTSTSSCPTISVTKAPAPKNLRVTSKNQTVVRLAWDPVTDAYRYKAERSTSSSGPWSTVRFEISGTARNDTGLTCGTHYYYRVSARGDGDPYSTEYGTPSAAISVTTDSCNATPPTPTPVPCVGCSPATPTDTPTPTPSSTKTPTPTPTPGPLEPPTGLTSTAQSIARWDGEVEEWRVHPEIVLDWHDVPGTTVTYEVEQWARVIGFIYKWKPLPFDNFGIDCTESIDSRTHCTESRAVISGLDYDHVYDHRVRVKRGDQYSEWTGRYKTDKVPFPHAGHQADHAVKYQFGSIPTPVPGAEPDRDPGVVIPAAVPTAVAAWNNAVATPSPRVLFCKGTDCQGKNRDSRTVIVNVVRGLETSYGDYVDGQTDCGPGLACVKSRDGRDFDYADADGHLNNLEIAFEVPALQPYELGGLKYQHRYVWTNNRDLHDEQVEGLGHTYHYTPSVMMHEFGHAAGLFDIPVFLDNPYRPGKHSGSIMYQPEKQTAIPNKDRDNLRDVYRNHSPHTLPGP